MFGETAAAGQKGLPTENESPDLLGIQQMLQMVILFKFLENNSNIVLI